MSTIPLKRIANIIAGQSPASDDVDPYDGGQPFLQGNAEFGALAPQPRWQCSVASKVARPGDVLLSVRAPVGAVNVADQRYGIGRGLCAVRPNSFAREYLWWYLQSQTAALRSVATGSTFEAVSAADVGSLSVPALTPEQMSAIASFLDRETAKIDALIDKQEQLIATLREESDALWSAELNRLSGLAPSMEIRRVIKSIVDGPFGSSLTSSHYSADGARVIRLGNIGVNYFKDDDRAYIPLDYANSLSTHEVKEGDVVVAGLGDDQMPLGRAALVPPIGPAIVKADCYRVRPRAELMRPDYLAWALSAPPTRNQIALLARGATRARLNTSVVKEVEIPVPSLRDQAEAVSRAREHLSKIDFLMSKATQLSDTLREYRSALITNAVTGKIDVREAV